MKKHYPPEGHHCHCARIVTGYNPETQMVTIADHYHARNKGWCPNDNCKIATHDKQ
jgi:hypothetical protein